MPRAKHRISKELLWGQTLITDLSLGKIRGIQNRGIKIFKGIPYGASTAGDNRSMPPTNPASWTGIRDALEYGHSCPQNDPPPPNPAAGSAPSGPKPAAGPSIF